MPRNMSGSRRRTASRSALPLALLFGAASRAASAPYPPRRLDAPRCPGSPECSGHGTCRAAAGAQAVACECHAGFFGKDCGRRERDCARLRSCADCQNAANQKFCGWCADARYCVPKHVHHELKKHKKACTAWHEDSCPRNRTAVQPHEFDALGYSIFEEWGDEARAAARTRARRRGRRRPPV